MRPTRHRSRALAAALAVCCAAGLASCGDDDAGGGSADPPDRSSRFEAELEELPGVVGAEVEEEIVEGEGIEQLDVEVVVADDATEAEVAAALDTVADYDRDLGFEQHHSVVVERDGAEDYPLSHHLSYGHEPDETAAELVRRWVLVEERLDPALAWTADGYGVVTVQLAEDAGADDVTALAEQVRSDPDLAALPRWTVVAEGDDARYYFATENGMSDAVVASWTTAVANLALGPEGTSLTLSPQNSPGSSYADPPPAGSMRLGVGLDLPGVVPPGQLTPARWGDRLWPLLRAQLDVVRGLPPSSRFDADNFYRESDGTGGALDQFLYVSAGEPATPEDPDRGWNAAAARYLAGAGGGG